MYQCILSFEWHSSVYGLTTAKAQAAATAGVISKAAVWAVTLAKPLSCWSIGAENFEISVHCVC